MAVEIEIKAWVRRPGQTRGLIEKLCVFETEYVKEDTYFRAPRGSFLALSGAGVRVRRENGQWECTFKEKTLRDGLEVNEENEFSLSDGALFMDLLEKLGCTRTIVKVKTGRRYSCRGLNVEISDVKTLGLFVEAEKVLEAASEEDMAAWEKTIRRFFADIGIREPDIEARPYSVMLAEKHGQGG
jgi:adenylate cyclase class 2